MIIHGHPSYTVNRIEDSLVRDLRFQFHGAVDLLFGFVTQVFVTNGHLLQFQVSSIITSGSHVVRFLLGTFGYVFGVGIERESNIGFQSRHPFPEVLRKAGLTIKLILEFGTVSRPHQTFGGILRSNGVTAGPYIVLGTVFVETVRIAYRDVDGILRISLVEEFGTGHSGIMTVYQPTTESSARCSTYSCWQDYPYSYHVRS